MTVSCGGTLTATGNACLPVIVPTNWLWALPQTTSDEEVNVAEMHLLALDDADHVLLVVSSSISLHPEREPHPASFPLQALALLGLVSCFFARVRVRQIPRGILQITMYLGSEPHHSALAS